MLFFIKNSNKGKCCHFSVDPPEDSKYSGTVMAYCMSEKTKERPLSGIQQSSYDLEQNSDNVEKYLGVLWGQAKERQGMYWTYPEGSSPSIEGP